MFRIDLGPGRSSIGVVGQRIQTGTILFRDFAQPTAVPRSRKGHSHQQQASQDSAELHGWPRSREKNWSIS